MRSRSALAAAHQLGEPEKPLNVFFVLLCLVAQSGVTLCDPMDYSRPPPTQAPLSMGILQARVLEWDTMLSSRGPSQLRDQIQVSHIASGFFTI